MRFLVDECTGPRVAAWLRGQGHEVFDVREEARGASDVELLEKAASEGWILITNDNDFGELVFREGRRHGGVVLLRLDPETTATKIASLGRLLDLHGSELPERFVVVSERVVRFAGG